MKLIVHCQSSAPNSTKPGQKLNAAKFASDVTTPAAKLANAAVFKDGIPGIVLQLGNLTDQAAGELEAGKLYQVTIEEVK